MYLILLLTHRGNLEKVNETNRKWLDHCGVPYIIVYGDTNIKDDYNIQDKHTLVVKCPDTYEYLTLKLACAYKFIVTSELTKNIRGVFKVDDDVLINIKQFQSYIKNSIQEDYAGHAYEISKDCPCSHHQTKTKNTALQTITFRLKESIICYGPMYYLSRRALNIIVSKFSYHNFNIYSTEMFEDYTFGNILKQNGIDASCMKMFTDHVDQFKNNSGFIALHDADHTRDLLSLHENININN